MGKHDDTCEAAGRELTNRRLRAVVRRRRIRRERHSWRFVNLGLAVAILVGSGLATVSGQQAAAQAAEEEAAQGQGTIVQADWPVDDVLADMAVEHAEKEAVEQAAREEAEAQAAAEAAAKAEEERKAAEEAARVAAAEAEAEAAAAEAAANPWTAPSNARITSFFGMRNGSLHGGTDFGNFEGEEIWSVGAGTIAYIGFEAGGYGNVVYVDHGNGIETRYAHASEILVGVGDEVDKGQAIMLAGSTGRSTGPHLHFEVLIDGEKVDSLAWLEDQGVAVG
jgi:murein DD-endopeptidase MepM/ murein hydrolase activator NlpD